MKLFSKSKSMSRSGRDNTRGGFTLIELLVVISIISLLSSVVLSAVKDAKQKAQVNAFVTQMKQVQNALELYRSDNGDYPKTTVNGNNGLLNIVLPNLSSYLPSFTEYSIATSGQIYYIKYPPTITLFNNYRCNTTSTSTTYILRIPNNTSTVLPSPLYRLTNQSGTIIYNYYCLTFQ